MAVSDIGAQAVNVDVPPSGDVLAVQPGEELFEVAPIGGNGVRGMSVQSTQEVGEGGTACGRRQLVQGRGFRFTQGAMTRAATCRR